MQTVFYAISLLPLCALFSAIEIWKRYICFCELDLTNLQSPANRSHAALSSLHDVKVADSLVEMWAL